jgi:hypothetical protein
MATWFFRNHNEIVIEMNETNILNPLNVLENQIIIRYDPDSQKLLMNYTAMNLTDYEIMLDNQGDLQTFVI